MYSHFLFLKWWCSRCLKKLQCERNCHYVIDTLTNFVAAMRLLFICAPGSICKLTPISTLLRRHISPLWKRTNRELSIHHRNLRLRHFVTMNDSTSGTGSTAEDPLVQYILVRRDLLDTWPTGSVMAQAVHASVAAVWQSQKTANTQSYCEQPGNADEHSTDSPSLPQMHTVILEAKNDTALIRLADNLKQSGLPYVLWREQPENIVTALASHPSPRSAVKKYFSKFRLFK